MRVVTQMGLAYHVPEYKYRRMLIAIKNSETVDLANYGRPLGEVTNITDWDSLDAAYQLKLLEGK